MNKFILISSLAVLSAMSQAVMFESEPNDTIATADMILRGGPGPMSEVAIASLAVGPGDVDFYAIRLEAGETLTAITTPLDGATFTTPDTIMALFDSSGEIRFNDDAGNGFGSAFRHNITTTGLYWIGVSGFGDRDFTGGDHLEAGNYTLTVSVVPEPATMTALALGAAALLRRRRA